MSYFERFIDLSEHLKDMDIEKIKKKINSKIKINDDGCFEWCGEKTKGDYGRIHINNKGLLAHRVSFFIYKGIIPNSYTIDHLCKNTKCVNPVHLEAVTMKQNNLRGISFSSINSKKTHCLNGHEFNNENTFVYKDGRRGCKLCMKQSYYKNKDKIKIARKEYYKLKKNKNV